MRDFATLRRPFKPNNYLVADKESCPRACADQSPPAYAAPPPAVQAAWERVIADQPRLQQTGADPDTMTFEYVQRTALLGFPDTITVRFVPAAQGGTRVLVYSASKLGFSDLGVNRRRVRSWLAALEAELADA